MFIAQLICRITCRIFPKLIKNLKRDRSVLSLPECTNCCVKFQTLSRAVSQAHTRRGCGAISLVFAPTPILKSLAWPRDNRMYIFPVEHECLKVYLHTCWLLTGKHGDLLLERLHLYGCICVQFFF